MSVTEIGDPRLQVLFGKDGRDDGEVRPTVKLARRGMSSTAMATCTGYLLSQVAHGFAAGVQHRLRGR